MTPIVTGNGVATLPSSNIAAAIRSVIEQPRDDARAYPVIGQPHDELLLGQGRDERALETYDERGALSATATTATTATLVADAGADAVVAGGMAHLLDGSKSRVPAGQNARYEWKQLEGPVVALTASADGKQAQFMAPKVTAATPLLFQLTVVGADGVQSTDTVSVSVRPLTNGTRPLPTTTRSIVKQVVSGTRYNLTGLGWKQVEGPTMSLSPTTAPVGMSFITPDVTTTTSLRFRATLNSGTGTLVTEVQVLVHPKGKAFIDLGGERTLKGNETLQLTPKTGGVMSGYRWKQLSGPALALGDATQPVLSLRSPVVQAATSYQFELSAIDNKGQTITSRVTLTVLPEALPIAKAGADVRAPAGRTVKLDGSKSQALLGQLTSYKWEQIGNGPRVTLQNASSAKASFTSPVVSTLSTVQFRLTVTNSQGQKHSDEVSVELRPAGEPPRATIDGPSTDKPDDKPLVQGQSLVLKGNPGDTEGDKLTYQWQQIAGPTVTFRNGLNQRNLAITVPQPLPLEPEESLPQILKFRLIVTETEGEKRASAPAEFSVKVDNVIPKAMPVMLSKAMPEGTIRAGAEVLLDGGASSDPDGLIAGYLWKQTGGPTLTLPADRTQAQLRFMAPANLTEPTTYVFELRVIDNFNRESAWEDIRITVLPPSKPEAKIRVTNEAGRDIEAGRVGSGQAGIKLDGGASVGANAVYDGAPKLVSYEWQQIGTPAVLLRNANSAQATFDAPLVGRDSPLTFRLTVTNAEGVTHSREVVVTVSQNKAPAKPAVTVTAGATPGAFTVSATTADEDGSITSYKWEQLSGTAIALNEITSTSAQFSFVAPELALPGASGVRLRVTVRDNNGQIETREVVVSDWTAGSVRVHSEAQPRRAAPLATQPASASAALLASSAARPAQASTPLSVVAPTQPVKGGDLVSLSVSGGPAGLVSYQWRQLSGAAVESMVGQHSQNLRFSVPLEELDPETNQPKPSEGPLRFEVWGIDAQGRFERTELTLARHAVEVRITDGDQRVTGGKAFTLDGSQSWAAKAPRTYKWEQVRSGNELELKPLGATGTQAMAKFKAPVVLTETRLTYRLTVTDGGGQTASELVTLTLQPANVPRADAGADQTLYSGQQLGLTANEHNDAADDYLYSWRELTAKDFDPSLEKDSVPILLLSGDDSRWLAVTAPSDLSDLPKTVTLRLTVTDKQGKNPKTDDVVLTLRNEPPTASIKGPEKALVDSGMGFVLDAGGSFDSEGGALRFAWQQVAGPYAAYSYVTDPGDKRQEYLLANSRVMFRAPVVTEPTQLVFRLTVTDDLGGVSTQEVRVAVQPRAAAKPPTIAFKQPGLAQGGQRNTLNAQITAGDGLVTSYAWQQLEPKPGGKKATLELQNGAELSYIAPIFTAADAAAGLNTLTFELTVSDSNGKSHTQSVKVTVAPLTAELPRPQIVGPVGGKPGQALQLDAGSSVPMGQLQYRWRQVNATPSTTVTLLNPTQATLGFTAPLVEGAVTLELTVTDAWGRQSTLLHTVTISNESPNVGDKVLPDVNNGDEVTLSIDASDVDGGLKFYSWQQADDKAPRVVVYNLNSVSPTFKVPHNYALKEDVTLRFELTVTDSFGKTKTGTVSVKVKANQPPTALVIAPEAVAYNAAAILDGGRSFDPEGEALTYIWEQIEIGDGPRITLTRSRDRPEQAEFRNSGFKTDTIVKFQLTVKDAQGLVSRVVTTGPITLQALSEPDLTFEAATSDIKGGGRLHVIPTLTDREGSVREQVWTYSIAGSTPAPFTPGTSTGAGCELPRSSTGYDVTVTATLGYGPAALNLVKTVSKTISVKANQPPQAKFSISDPIPSAWSYKFTLNGSESKDLDNLARTNQLKYRWSSIQLSTGKSLGSFMSENGPNIIITDFNAHVFSEAQVARGENKFRITLQVTTGDDRLVSSTFQDLEVPANKAPEVNAGPSQTVNAGTSVQLLGTAATPDPWDRFSYSWSQPHGPVAVSLANPHSLTPSFTPSIPGTYTFRLTASNLAGDTRFHDVVITVNAAPPPPPPANSKPKATREVATQYLSAPRNTSRLKLSLPRDLFSDDKGIENLKYSTSFGTCTADSSRINFILPRKLGFNTVILRATDAEGEYAEITFQVHISPTDHLIMREKTDSTGFINRQHVAITGGLEPARTGTAFLDLGLTSPAAAKADASELGWDDVSDAAWRVLAKRQGASQPASAALWSSLADLGGDDD